MAIPTQEEIDAELEPFRNITRESLRMSRLPEVKAFIEGYCELVSNTTLHGPPEIYQIAGRNKTKPLIELKRIIRDHIPAGFRNPNNPHYIEDIDSRVDDIIYQLFRMSAYEKRNGEFPLYIPAQLGGGRGRLSQDNPRGELGPPDDPGPPDNPGPP